MENQLEMETTHDERKAYEIDAHEILGSLARLLGCSLAPLSHLLASQCFLGERFSALTYPVAHSLMGKMSIHALINIECVDFMQNERRASSDGEKRRRRRGGRNNGFLGKEMTCGNGKECLMSARERSEYQEEWGRLRQNQ